MAWRCIAAIQCKRFSYTVPSFRPLVKEGPALVELELETGVCDVEIAGRKIVVSRDESRRVCSARGKTWLKLDMCSMGSEKQELRMINFGIRGTRLESDIVLPQIMLTINGRHAISAWVSMSAEILWFG